MTKTTGTERELIVDMLLEVCEKGEYSHLVLGGVLDKHAYLEKQQKAFLTRVFDGTIEYLLQLDAVLNRYSKVKVNKMKPLIRNLLRMSVYQILYMDAVPDSAVCNEAVKLARKRGMSGLSGFVNGVLRTISRQKDSITFSTLSEKYAMPQWLIEEWQKEYDQEIIENTLQSFLQPRPVSIRCQTSFVSPEQLKERLEEEKVTVRALPYLEEAFEISEFDSLSGLQSFQEGLFQIQDLSSMFDGVVACPKPESHVIDVCAAPGGKALHIADLLHGTGNVQARDLSDYKVSMIEENIRRSRLKNIEALCQDATVLDPGSVETADLVIADLPCSGLGVIGRKPEIKYRITLQQIHELQQLQRQILSVVWQYVKPGGTLIYSTCTISRMENEENVEWFLKEYPFESVSLEECLSQNLQSETKKKGWIQLIPGVHHTDGFFVAKFRRKG